MNGKENPLLSLLTRDRNKLAKLYRNITIKNFILLYFLIYE